MEEMKQDRFVRIQLAFVLNEFVNNEKEFLKNEDNFINFKKIKSQLREQTFSTYDILKEHHKFFLEIMQKPYIMESAKKIIENACEEIGIYNSVMISPAINSKIHTLPISSPSTPTTSTPISSVSTPKVSTLVSPIEYIEGSTRYEKINNSILTILSSDFKLNNNILSELINLIDCHQSYEMIRDGKFNRAIKVLSALYDELQEEKRELELSPEDSLFNKKKIENISKFTKVFDSRYAKLREMVEKGVKIPPTPKAPKTPKPTKPTKIEIADMDIYKLLQIQKHLSDIKIVKNESRKCKNDIIRTVNDSKKFKDDREINKLLMQIKGYDDKTANIHKKINSYISRNINEMIDMDKSNSFPARKVIKELDCLYNKNLTDNLNGLIKDFVFGNEIPFKTQIFIFDLYYYNNKQLCNFLDKDIINCFDNKVKDCFINLVLSNLQEETIDEIDEKYLELLNKIKDNSYVEDSLFNKTSVQSVTFNDIVERINLEITSSLGYNKEKADDILNIINEIQNSFKEKEEEIKTSCSSAKTKEKEEEMEI